MASMAPEPELECPICHELFSSPKILPCNHLACRDCVTSWLKKGGQGGCPLCRAPILSPTHPGQGHLDTLVDALPTDLLTESLVKGHEVITGPDVCAMCPHNMAATYYCFECEDKLCATCSRHHKRARGTRDHSLQDLHTLTAQDLSDHFHSPCQNQAGRTAEVYCSSHRELICALCAVTHHRSCAEIKVMADVANEKRRELGQLVQRRRTKEAALARQIRARKDSYDQQRREVTKAFDDLEREVKKRRQECLDVIQMEENNDVDLEKIRAMMASLTVTMERLLRSTSDGVVVQMETQLEPRSREVERRCGQADNVKAVQAVQLDSQRIADIKSALSALGQKGAVHAAHHTTPAVSTTPTTHHTTPAVSTTPTTPHTTPAVSTTPTTHHTTPAVSTTPTTYHTTPAVSTISSPAGSIAMARATIASASTPTTPKPRGAALARVLKVGDRVRLSDSGRRRHGGRDSGPGTVTAIPSRISAADGWDSQGKVDVRWDGGRESTYWMGCSKMYNLDLL